MPLTPATTDKVTKVGNPGTATTMAAPGYTTGVSTSIQVGSTTNWPTDTKVIFAIDRAQVVNGTEERIAGTYNEFEGIVTGANTIANLVRRYGTAQNYVAGSLTRIYIPVAATRENDLVEGFAQDHNLKGNHINLTDNNGNEFLERGSVASAVNHVKVTNAITGAAAKIEAAGDDATVNLEVEAKGASGLVKVQGAVPQKFFALYDFIESGCVLTGTGYGSTLGWSLTAGIVWIGGKRLTVAAAASTVTASRDTYFDLLDAGNGTATLVNTAGNIVVNNAASPALAANSVRLGIVCSGATNIPSAVYVNQGQETAQWPQSHVNSVYVMTTDTLGNLICPRDPQRRILGYRTTNVTSNTASTTPFQITGLIMPIMIPTGRKVKIIISSPFLFNNTTNARADLGAYEGSLAGAQIAIAHASQSLGTGATNGYADNIYTPASSSLSYYGGLKTVGAGTATADKDNPTPIYIRAELV